MRKTLNYFDLAYTILVVLILIGSFNAPKSLFNKLEFKITDVQATNQKIIVYSPTPTPYIDDRARKLGSFLESVNSPLKDYSNLIVKSSDDNGISYTLLVGISKMESSYGNRIPSNSFNAWGIMNGNKVRYFSSWEESISEVSRLLGSNYTFNMNRGIQQKYCPDSSGCNSSWANIVTSAQQEILQY